MKKIVFVILTLFSVIKANAQWAKIDEVYLKGDSIKFIWFNRLISTDFGVANKVFGGSGGQTYTNGTGLSLSNGQFAVTATTTQISEGANQYFTNARGRSAISLTTTGTGAATYNTSTGVLNVPTPTATTYTAGTGLTLTGNTFALDGAYSDGRYLKVGGNSPTSSLFVGTLTNQSFGIVQGSTNNNVLYATSNGSNGGTDNIIMNTDRGVSLYAGLTTNNYAYPALNISNEENGLGGSLSRKSTDIITWSTSKDNKVFGMYGGNSTAANNNRNVFIIGEDGRLAFKAGRGSTTTHVFKDSASYDLTSQRIRARNLDPLTTPMITNSQTVTTDRVEIWSQTTTSGQTSFSDNEGNVTVSLTLPVMKKNGSVVIYINTESGSLGGLTFTGTTNQSVITTGKSKDSFSMTDITNCKGVVTATYFADSITNGRWFITSN